MKKTKGGRAMRVKEFLIEQNEERINIIDLSNDLVRAFITLDLTEDKNYMKEKLELAFEIARRSLLKYTENSFSVDGLRVIKKAIVEEIYICDESNTEQKNKRYIFIVASKKLLDKAKEIIENILQY
jgi:translation initiation factor 2B subunit (eIF-2B alpha/beta/delta family)